jgi:molecular chaperone DnaK
MAADNKTLGRFILDGIPTAPRGIPQVEVSFDIDANGILNVKAKDKATNKEQKITITASSGLSKEEVENMKKEAELHAEEDKKKREQIETKNQAEAVIFQTEKLIKDAGDKIKPEELKELQDKIEDLKKAKDSDNLEDIKKKLEEVNTIAQKIGAAMYQQAQAQGAQPGAEAGAQSGAEQPAAGEPKKEEGPIEGEFTEKK